MTEWLLSGHNTQETSSVAPPLTETINVTGLNEEINWSLAMMAGGLDGFDLSIPPSVTVQNRLYLNVSYFMRNMAIAMPFDPESIGAPNGIVEPYGPIPLRRKLLLPWHIYTSYRWGKQFYEKDLPAITQIERDLYQQLRTAPEPPLEAIEQFFAPETFDYTDLISKAHIVITSLVIMIDSILREKRPELLGLFVGYRTTTSMMAEHIWNLRNVAQQCGTVVTDKIKAGVAELDVYRQIPEAAPFVAGIEEFLHQYGHRGFHYESDLGAERLDDHPEYVILAIGGQLDVLVPPPDRARIAQEQAEAALQKPPIVERFFWKKLLGWGRKLISWRENSKSMMVMRQAIIALSARRLARYYRPERPEDELFFYTSEEFIEFVHSKGRKRVPDDTLNRRKAEYELNLVQAPPPELIWYNPDTRGWRPVKISEQGNSMVEGEALRQLQGIPVSAGPGPVEGIALVTSDPMKAMKRLMELKENVILVTRFTDPAWSSLFGRLTGVVTELGGVVSHAAIVAREHGLPAVVGVTGILNWVHDGQQIRIDGRKGTVEILD